MSGDEIERDEIRRQEAERFSPQPARADRSRRRRPARDHIRAVQEHLDCDARGSCAIGRHGVRPGTRGSSRSARLGYSPGVLDNLARVLLLDPPSGCSCFNSRFAATQILECPSQPETVSPLIRHIVDQLNPDPGHYFGAAMGRCLHGTMPRSHSLSISRKCRRPNEICFKYSPTPRCAHWWSIGASGHRTHSGQISRRLWPSCRRSAFRSAGRAA